MHVYISAIAAFIALCSTSYDRRKRTPKPRVRESIVGHVSGGAIDTTEHAISTNAVSQQSEPSAAFDIHKTKQLMDLIGIANLRETDKRKAPGTVVVDDERTGQLKAIYPIDFRNTKSDNAVGKLLSVSSGATTVESELSSNSLPVEHKIDDVIPQAMGVPGVSLVTKTYASTLHAQTSMKKPNQSLDSQKYIRVSGTGSHTSGSYTSHSDQYIKPTPQYHHARNSLSDGKETESYGLYRKISKGSDLDESRNPLLYPAQKVVRQPQRSSNLMFLKAIGGISAENVRASSITTLKEAADEDGRFTPPPQSTDALKPGRQNIIRNARYTMWEPQKDKSVYDVAMYTPDAEAMLGGAPEIIESEYLKLPLRNAFPPLSAADRRQIKSNKLRVGTFNAKILTLNKETSNALKTSQERVNHARYVALCLQQMASDGADVIVVQEVDSFATMEYVRRLMGEQGADYRVYNFSPWADTLAFNTVLLTKIDPVMPLGQIIDENAPRRHFVARLQPWLNDEGTAKTTVDIYGVHFTSKKVCINEGVDYRDQEALAIGNAVAGISLIDPTVIPIVVGDMNDWDPSVCTNSLSTEETELKSLAIKTLKLSAGLVDCFDGHTRHQSSVRTHRSGNTLDHILVPRSAVPQERYPEPYRSMQCNVIRTSPDPNVDKKVQSDHFPVLATIQIGPNMTMSVNTQSRGSSMPCTEGISRSSTIDLESTSDENVSFTPKQSNKRFF